MGLKPVAISGSLFIDFGDDKANAVDKMNLKCGVLVSTFNNLKLLQ
nr:hypothetical protein [Mucilaginibacter sp. X4EP1]